MSDWIYDKSKNLEDFYGFVYKITLPNGKYYIGQKKLWLDNKRRIGKRELEKKGKSNFRFYYGKVKGKKQRVYYEEGKKLDFKNYYGSSSSDDISNFINKNGAEKVKREIIGFAKTKRDLTYWELYYLITNNVLFDKNNLNGNILGRFFAGKIEKLIK